MELITLKKLKRESSGIGFFLFTSILVMYFISIIGVLISSIIFSYDTTVSLLLDNIVSIISFFIIGLFYCTLSNTQVTDILPVKRVKTGLTFKLVAMAFAVAFLSDCVTELIVNGFSLFGIHNNVEMTFKSNGIIENILYIISIAVIPALVEEFAFRGIILQKLRKYGDGFAILMSASLFGLMHGNIVQIPFAFIIGLVLGFITVKTGSIIPAVITHFCNNCVSVIVSIIEDNNLLETNLTDTIYISFMIMIIILGIISSIFLSRKKGFFTLKKYNEISFKDRIKAFSSSTGIIMSYVLIGIEIIISVLQ